MASSSSSSSLVVHRHATNVPITLSSSNDDNDNDAMSVPSLTHSGCKWTFWNKTGFFCGGGLQPHRDEFAPVLNGNIATYETYFKGLRDEVDCITFAYQAGLRFTLQVFSTDVTRQSMNLDRLNNGYNPRLCPAASGVDKPACQAPDECLVTELSTSCQPLFTTPTVLPWDGVAYMSYRIHFVQDATITFKMKILNDSCAYQWRANDDWSACPSGCGNFTQKRTVDCITDAAFGTTSGGRPVNLPDNYGCFAAQGGILTTRACPNAICPPPSEPSSSTTILGIPALIVYIVGPLIVVIGIICCVVAVRKLRRARARAAADAAYAAFDYPLMMSETHINGDTEDDQ